MVTLRSLWLLGSPLAHPDNMVYLAREHSPKFRSTSFRKTSDTPRPLCEIRLLIYYEYENSKESKDILENYSNIPNLSLV